MSPVKVIHRLLVAALVALVVAFGLLHLHMTLTGVRPYDQPLFDEGLFAEMSRVAARGGLPLQCRLQSEPIFPPKMSTNSSPTTSFSGVKVCLSYQK